MKYDKITRRFFLQGLGKATLALPFLPSLFSSKAVAQMLSQAQKSFIGFGAQNGLFRMNGPTSILMPRTNPVNNLLPDYQFQDLAGKHRIHYKSLVTLATENGGKISDLINSNFTPYLNKMLMMQGFDYLALGWRHHHGQFGNMAASFSGPNGMPEMATIDQVMAYSSSFYKASHLLGKSVAFTANSRESKDYGVSYTWSNPSSRITSSIVGKAAFSNPATLWDSFFSNNTNPPSSGGTNLKSLLVDQVLTDYKSLRASRRLATEDKQKLDQHIALLYEAQKSAGQVGAACNSLRPNSSLTDRKMILQAMNDVIVSLIACGHCHSFMGWANSILSSNPEDFHTWSHEAYDASRDAIGDSTAYNKIVDQNRSTLHDFFLDLMTKLDRANLLDNCLIAWIQEHNNRGHASWNVPVILAGSAGGILKTGQYIDYRDLRSGDDRENQRVGFPITQLLANLLQATDVPPSEYESYNKSEFSNSLFVTKSGYGHSKYDPDGFSSVVHGHYKSWSGHNLSSWLPLLRA